MGLGGKKLAINLQKKKKSGTVSTARSNKQTTSYGYADSKFLEHMPT